jgi:quinol monooxygenase YgiN
VRAIHALVIGLAVVSAIGTAHAQEAAVYSVTYVEVVPTAAASTPSLLRRYCESAIKESGNLRCELLQRIGAPHQLVVLEIWKDRETFEAHGKTATLQDTRERISAIRNAPTDERVHNALAVGPIGAKTARGAVYVVTHVDVIPPRKDDGVAMLRQLAADSRQHEGNLRFEVVQQMNRPNHFTVVEIWKDAKALEAHSMAPATRRFRDALAPATGALYDERTYTLTEH